MKGASSQPGPASHAPRRARRRGAQQAWLAAIAVAVGVHAAAFMWLGVSPGQRQEHPAIERGARWAGEQAGENIDLISPEPLFLPTRWNAATQIASETEGGGPGAIFGPVPPELTVATGSSPAGLVVLPEGVRTAGVAIRRFSRPYFSALGHEDQVLTRLTSRAGAIEIRDAATGKLWLRHEVSGAAVANSLQGGGEWPFWEPFELLFTVESTGTLGLPLIPAPGSGVEAVDNFFRSSLRRMIRLDLHLPAGYYRALVGP